MVNKLIHAYDCKPSLIHVHSGLPVKYLFSQVELSLCVPSDMHGADKIFWGNVAGGGGDAEKCIDYEEDTLGYKEIPTVNKIDNKAF